ncbi:Nramp family divalent metal transporter [uncultured Zhongshania sp.]|uniref:Nramp family divalent metal transporter n=1 Tax=uncultured Zhongshania sp. TaxID=1642288 RepID=UPI0025E4C64F|nr:Nramp family divalent metal transporter [uncultured Zhongshania sp.]
MKQLRALTLIGPGFVVAATGLGAGDLVAAAVSGAKLGTQLLWAIAFGAVIKLALNEGLARWQLASGTSLLTGWLQHLPRWINYYFLAYLFIWAFLVGAALMAACGLAANALFPQLSINSWASLHSLLAIVLVLFGRYSLFEQAMKALILLMFATVMAALLASDWSSIGSSSTTLGDISENFNLVMALIGGVGGSVTLLCYGYWMREKGWHNTDSLKIARIDLLVAYSITALFGMGIMILAAQSAPESESGTHILIAMADQLGLLLSPVFKELFLIGVWAAVFSSMLGVWQGVPYIFTDSTAQWRSKLSKIDSSDKGYRLALLYIALPPIALLYLGKPVWLIILYSVTGALFMPFLALTLLYLNNRIIKPSLRYGVISNSAIVVALLVFSYIGAHYFLS